MLKCFKLVLFALSLVACHPSSETIKKVNQLTYSKKEKTISCPINNAQRCAIDSPLSNLYEVAIHNNRDYLTLLEKGSDSLLLRLHMIKAAQKSIDIQTFIWVNDESGHLVLAELLAAAKRGVKVNIIIDQLFSMGNSWFLAELATLHENLNIKMFNPTFNEGHTSAFDFVSALACCLYNLNRRMHNKLFLVDDKYGINGGRNYHDTYFDWDARFNYRDRDALAVGRVATEMKKSFYDFWDSPWVVPLENLDDIAHRILNNQERVSKWEVAQKPRTVGLNLLSYNYNHIKELFVDTAMAADSLIYFSDLPEKLFVKKQDLKEQKQQMSIKIKDLILSAKKDLLFQTPYLVLSREAYKALKQLQKMELGVNIRVSTNSLSSTDAFYVYAISYKHKKKYLRKIKLNIFEYKANPQNKVEMFGQEYAHTNTRFGLHAKSIVIDNYISLIGSHNFDQRSDILNTESGLIVESTEIAEKLSAFIETDMLPENAWVIAPKKKIPILSFFSGIIATVSRSLPTLDIWPFRYSSSFQLRPGKTAVATNHEDFYENYRNVGSFPGVELSSKQIQTIIISAFAGFAEPFM
ncbi:MAG TPA: phospholipase D family protein [Oceanospirillales bacterium]|nr:phospholipase D family protein [Oceanospirillales bacterium]